jgi:hypothetical protein
MEKMKKANPAKAGDAKPTSLRPQGDDGRVASNKVKYPPISVVRTRGLLIF